MKVCAADSKVTVLMGYNKNVCKYVSKTREFASSVDDGHVTYVSNNTVSEIFHRAYVCYVIVPPLFCLPALLCFRLISLNSTKTMPHPSENALNVTAKAC